MTITTITWTNGVCHAVDAPEPLRTGAVEGVGGKPHIRGWCDECGAAATFLVPGTAVDRHRAYLATKVKAEAWVLVHVRRHGGGS